MNNEIIENLAENVRHELGLNDVLNVDMDIVLEKLGITLKIDETHEVEGSFTKGEKGFEITLSKSYDGTNKRDKFTLAHEIGHLFLQYDPENPNRVFNRKGQTEEEYQANRFAAAFLMPQSLYLDSLNKHAIDNKVDMSEVANDFGVSVEAARTRGRFLGYLSWN